MLTAHQLKSVCKINTSPHRRYTEGRQRKASITQNMSHVELSPFLQITVVPTTPMQKADAPQRTHSPQASPLLQSGMGLCWEDAVSDDNSYLPACSYPIICTHRRHGGEGAFVSCKQHWAATLGMAGRASTELQHQWPLPLCCLIGYSPLVIMFVIAVGHKIQ